ncbi:MAG: hemin uptake protein HemP [Burkholderiales bacterium]|nr:hemin uptake protein HemP [Burkholderiales bacterium]
MSDALDKSTPTASTLTNAAPREAPPRRVLESRELFAGGHELHIEHNGFLYTLRLTSKGKLILTK